MKSDPNKLLDLLLDESFQRWLSNRSGADEQAKWSTWLNQSQEHQVLYDEAKRLWQSAAFQGHSLPDTNEMVHRLLRSIQSIPQKKSLLDRLSSLRFRISRPQLAWRPVLAMGTAIVVVVAVTWLFRQIEWGGRSELIYRTLVTDYGQRVRLTFSDGSLIVVNARSVLKYPARWTPRTPRRFELEGEAYFHVTSLPEGPQHEFTVLTRDGEIRVTGTRFSVYERGNGTRVVVQEGSVVVSPAGAEGHSEAAPAHGVTLQENQLLLFTRDDPILSPIRVNAAPYTTWWQERFLLDRTPFKEIKQRLEETYGIQIEVEDRTLLTRTLSGAIENTNLDIVLEALARALRVSVHRERDQVRFSGPQQP